MDRPDSPTVKLHVVPMNIRHCQDICTWVYEPPYDIYQWNSWAQMEEDAEEFADSQIRETQYICIMNEDDFLIGYAQLFPLVGVTRLGLGMRPELCGQGLGAAFIRTIVEEARRRRPEDEIDLEVLEWNERARRAYAKAGFVVTDRYERPTPKGPMEFLCMVHEETLGRL
ncbi:GNAT family N-acetyltransferase [Gorillibacterium sp. sgz5001074]|uniref:GNAT family N-acetyltransferase n=1 Tax=Gorillibacterium sp. sgz5001074 TaxID=3446695 RepID=UPI003F676D4D